MATIIPSPWPAALMVLFLVMALFTSKRTKWIRHRRNTLITMSILAAILLPIQAVLCSNLLAFEYGNMNFSDEVSIAPQETHMSLQISNWFTTIDLSLVISSTGNVTLLLIDQNNLDISFEQGYYTEDLAVIRLPHLYSSPFVAANWTVCLYNPSINQAIQVEYYRLPPPPNGPPGIGVQYIYSIPFVMFLSFIVSMVFASQLVKQLKANQTREILAFLSICLSILFAYMIFNHELGVIFTQMLLFSSPFVLLALMIAIFVSAMRLVQLETNGTDTDAY